jgi:uncharacterized damage-inducible protein DinB
MSFAAQYQAMARYNAWMNERLLDHAATLTDAQRNEDRGGFFGSIHNTFNHLLLADRIWLGRLAGDKPRYVSRDASGAEIPFTSLAQILYADFEEFRRQRRTTDADLSAWVEGLSDEDLDVEVAYTNTRGDEFRHPLWCAAAHVFNHQTHHRGQITALLFQLGIDPGVTDLAVMLRQG